MPWPEGKFGNSAKPEGSTNSEATHWGSDSSGAYSIRKSAYAWLWYTHGMIKTGYMFLDDNNKIWLSRVQFTFMVKKQTNLAIKAWIIIKPILSFLLNNVGKPSYYKDHLYEINHNQGAYHAK